MCRLKAKEGELFFLIVCVIITNLFGFYTYFPGGLVLYSNDYVYCGLMAFSLIVLMARIIGGKASIKNNKITYNATVFLLIMLIETIESCYCYNESFVEVAKQAIYYFTPIMAYFAFDSIDCKPTTRYIDIIIKVSIVCSIVAIMEFFCYEVLGIDFLKLTYANNLLRERGGTIRFSIGGIVYILGLVISLTRLQIKKAKKIDRVNLVLGLFHLIFIYKTRTVILYLLVTVVISILCRKKEHYYIRSFITLGAITCGILLPATFVYIKALALRIIESDVGIQVRFEAAAYFIKQVLDRIILGIGFAGDTFYSRDTRLYHQSDVGIIGDINNFGIVGLVWLISFYIILFKKVWRYNGDNTEVECISKNISIYLLISCCSISILTISTSMYIFFAYFIIKLIDSYKRIDCEKDCEKDCENNIVGN